jgi:hypothetical protein
LAQGFRGSGAQGLKGSRVQGFKGSRVQEPLRGFQTLLRSVQGSHFVRSSIPALQISIGDWTSFLNTAEQCWNAERSEAIERHKVPLEFLIADGN